MLHHKAYTSNPVRGTVYLWPCHLPSITLLRVFDHRFHPGSAARICQHSAFSGSMGFVTYVSYNIISHGKPRRAFYPPPQKFVLPLVNSGLNSNLGHLRVSRLSNRRVIGVFVAVVTSVMSLPAVLTVAGSDPSGGAGIQVSTAFAEHSRAVC